MNELINFKKHLNKNKPQPVIQPMNQTTNQPMNQAIIKKQLDRFNTTCFFEN